MSLAAELREAGLRVVEVSGWPSKGGSWAEGGSPVGVMQHHTANPVPYPVDNLADPEKLKCNINTKPDGTVYLVAGEACNYSSGSGSSVVLNETLAGIPPPANAVDRDLEDDANGNPWYFNFENDHAGTGGEIPDVQLDAIVAATRVVCDYYGLSADAVVSHGEWTSRKSDPYWDADRRCIETIRTRVGKEDSEMTDAQMKELLAAIGKVPRGVWADYPGHSADEGGASAWQTLSRTKNNTDAILGDLAELGDEALSELMDAVETELVRRGS